jgi:prephenate dehydratase
LSSLGLHAAAALVIAGDVRQQHGDAVVAKNATDAEKAAARVEKAAAKVQLDALERIIYDREAQESRFKVLLNEKDPLPTSIAFEVKSGEEDD